MSGLCAPSPVADGTPAGVEPAAASEALARLLADPAFRASDRRRRLLEHLVRETLAGRSDRLKGFAIAVAVFGRDETFDPQTDPAYATSIASFGQTCLHMSHRVQVSRSIRCL